MTKPRTTELLDGVPVYEVPPDWIGRIYPFMNEDERPIIDWWARHPNGTLTPVYVGAIRPWKLASGPEGWSR